jgi:hypothetical protein
MILMLRQHKQKKTAISIGQIEDGNGRIHRFLIHNILYLHKLLPHRLMLTASAVMLKNLADYDASLEAFSNPLLQLIDYQMDEMGQMRIENDTAC